MFAIHPTMDLPMTSDGSLYPLISTPSDSETASPGRPNRGRMLVIGLLALVLVGGVAGIFLLSGRMAQQSTQGLVFTIPAGASETLARPGWDSAIAIPTDIRFDSPAEAVITVKNLDSVTQRAGPFLVGPGQTFTQRFPEPGRYPIVCTVDPLETVVVTVAG